MEALYATGEKALVDKYKLEIFQHTETSGRFNGESYVEFLKQLLAYYKGKIIFIEDGAPYDGSGVVKEFKQANTGRLTLE